MGSFTGREPVSERQPSLSLSFRPFFSVHMNFGMSSHITGRLLRSFGVRQRGVAQQTAHFGAVFAKSAHKPPNM